MSSTINILKYGSKSITYNLTFSNRKTLGIKVVPDGSVYVKAPLLASLEDINHKLKSKGHWILKQQIFFDVYKPYKPKREFVNGETHLYLGKQYKLQIQKAEFNSIKLHRTQFIVSSSDVSVNNLECIITAWYKEKAMIIFQELFHEACLIVKNLPIKPKMVIRKMQKRWGSCTQKGEIILNLDLIKAPKGCILYVIVHELCHLIHFNHTKDFYNLQNNLMPDWMIWKEKMEMIMA